jgi:hypothetical protein
MAKVQNTYVYWALALSFKSLQRDERNSPKESDASQKKHPTMGKAIFCVHEKPVS